MERMTGVEVVVRARADVGEGPVLDPRSGRLCWVDLTQGVLYESDPRGESTSVAVPTMLGAVAPRQAAEGFAVAISEGFGYLVDGTLEVADPVLRDPRQRMNDAKCDSRGRLWAGSTEMTFAEGQGALHCWEGGTSSRVVATGFTLPNGLGWDADGATMFLADSERHVLLRADFDADLGAVGSFTPMATVEDGLPDGLAVDIDGCLWVAVWGASEVRRYDPNGKVVGCIDLPVTQPSSCAFAEDGSLFITSAAAGLTPRQLQEQPLAGSVFAVATTTRGVPVAGFAG